MDPELLLQAFTNTPYANDMMNAGQLSHLIGKRKKPSPFERGSQRAMETVARSKETRKKMRELDEDEKMRSYGEGIQHFGRALVSPPGGTAGFGSDLMSALSAGLAGTQASQQQMQAENLGMYEQAMSQQQAEAQQRQKMAMQMLPYLQMTAAQRGQQQQRAKELQARQQYQKDLLAQGRTTSRGAGTPGWAQQRIIQLENSKFRYLQQRNKELAELEGFGGAGMSPEAKALTSERINNVYQSDINRIDDEIEKLRTDDGSKKSPDNYMESLDQDARRMSESAPTAPEPKAPEPTAEVDAKKNKLAELKARQAKLLKDLGQ